MASVTELSKSPDPKGGSMNSTKALFNRAAASMYTASAMATIAAWALVDHAQSAFAKVHARSRPGNGDEAGLTIVEVILLILLFVGIIFFIVKEFIYPALHHAASSASNCITSPGSANCYNP